MATYAIIKTGGKQYRAEAGAQLTIEKLEGERGSEVIFDQVLMVATEDGNVQVGVPTLTGVTVRGIIVEQTRDNKVLIHKYRKRKNSRKTMGHRQYITRVRISAIEA